MVFNQSVIKDNSIPLPILCNVKIYMESRTLHLLRHPRQKLTIHVPGRTVAILDRLCGDALFAKELLSSQTKDGDFGLFLLCCTVLRYEMIK